MQTMTTKIQQTDLALIQLRRSIQLFNLKDYISATTLAGAANEIFGQIAMANKGYNSTDGDKWFWDGMAKIYHKAKPSRGKIIQANNKIKNVLKHCNNGANNLVEADWENEAQSQIDYAIKNYMIAFDIIPNDRIIKKYVNWKWM